MSESESNVTHTVSYDENRFKFSLKETETKMVKDLVKVKISPLKIPITHVFGPQEQVFILNILKYDSTLCEVNNLSPTLIGQKVEHLLTFSAKYSTKMVDLVTHSQRECFPDPESENVFGYIFDSRTGYINITHLAGKYNLNFNRWEINNPDLIEKYCEITGLAHTEIILTGLNTYVLPGLCINFIQHVKPEFGNLMKTMSNVFVGLAQSK
jgi:hypothetical protein